VTAVMDGHDTVRCTQQLSPSSPRRRHVPLLMYKIRLAYFWPTQFLSRSRATTSTEFVSRVVGQRLQMYFTLKWPGHALS
jgi:hypothetical protein